jgi:hypothetical protein
MSIDTRTPQERRYDAERDGTLYIKPEPAEDPNYNPWDDIIPVLLDGTPAPYYPAPQPFGQLTDGTPIMGGWNGVPGSGQFDRWGVVHAEPEGFSLCVDDSGHIALSNEGAEPAIDIDGATVAQIAALRAFLNTDAIEQMLTHAIAWGRGDAEPPAA